LVLVFRRTIDLPVSFFSSSVAFAAISKGATPASTAKAGVGPARRAQTATAEKRVRILVVS
jgi:hypothetical protein